MIVKKSLKNWGQSDVVICLLKKQITMAYRLLQVRYSSVSLWAELKVDKMVSADVVTTLDQLAFL